MFYPYWNTIKTSQKLNLNKGEEFCHTIPDVLTVCSVNILIPVSLLYHTTNHHQIASVKKSIILNRYNHFMTRKHNGEIRKNSIRYCYAFQRGIITSTVHHFSRQEVFVLNVWYHKLWYIYIQRYMHKHIFTQHFKKVLTMEKYVLQVFPWKIQNKNALSMVPSPAT